MKILSLSLLLYLSGHCMFAQQTGEINYPYLGIKFTIPDGWKGEESDGYFIMGSDTETGLIIMIPHNVNQIDEMKAEAEQGFYDDGISLQKTGEFEKVGAEGIGAEFSGYLQGTEARAFIAGIINPFGTGITIMAATDAEHYSDRYRQLSKQLAMSLKFSQPQESQLTKDWRESLKKAKLTYMKSDYSSGASYEGYSTYSGYSSRREISFCPENTFTYYSSSSSSFDTGGGFGGTNSNNDGSGTWSVSTNSNGGTLLLLHFSDGREWSYHITYEDGKTYLDNDRYFFTDNDTCY